MREILADDSVSEYLDPTATTLLREGRERFDEVRLDRFEIIPFGSGSAFVPWVGDRALSAIEFALDWLAHDDLRARNYASRYLDVEGAVAAVAEATPVESVDPARAEPRSGRSRR